MNLFGAFIPAKNFFTNIFDRRNGVASLAHLSQLNQVVASMPIIYNKSTYSSSISAAETDQIDTNINAVPSINSVFSTRINQTVTNALTAGTKVNIIDFGTADFLPRIENIVVSIGVGTGGAPGWDGGDLELYNGDNLLGTITAATLATTIVGDADAYWIAIKGPSAKIGSGTYNITDGLSITPDSIISVRLTGETINFIGMIGVQVVISSNRDICGTFCTVACKGRAKDSLGCETKCILCPGTGFTSLDVI
jgi:hypothetical protein